MHGPLGRSGTLDDGASLVRERRYHRTDAVFLGMGVAMLASAGFALAAIYLLDLGAIGLLPGEVRFGSCVTSITGPNGGAQLYER